MRALPSVLRALLLLLALVVPRLAHAYVYFTPEQLLGTWFAGAETVETVIFTPSEADRGALKAQLGYALPKAAYEVRVGRKGGQVTGYAILDEQRGQHEPISFAVLLDASARVRAVEVLVYREQYGDGVRAEAFRKQFVGLDAAAPMKVGKDIQIVSGATISSRAIAVGTRRASALVTTWLSAQSVAAG